MTELERYQQMIRQCSLGFSLHQWSKEKKGAQRESFFVACNPSFEKLWDQSFSSLKESSTRAFLEANDNQGGKKYEALLRELEKEGEGKLQWFFSRRKRWYSLKCFSLDDHQFACVWDEITESVEQKESLHSLLFSLNDMVFELDDDYVFRKVWASQEEHLLFPRDYILHKSLNEVFGDAEAQKFLDALQTAKKTGKKSVLEYPAQIKGEERWFRAEHQQKRGDFEHPGYIVVIQDITDQKKAELAQKESQSLFQKVFETLPIGLWMTDKNGTLLAGNPAGVEIWGAEPHVSPKDYGVFKAWKLPSGEEVRAEDWALLKTISEGVTIKNELLEIESFDGKRKVILNHTAPFLSEDGQILGAIVVNEDITERHQARKELEEAKEEAQKASRVKSLFLANMSHEIRTPLNGIMGFSQLLEATELSSEQREFLGFVISSSQRLLAVIDDILDISKVESGKIELELHPFDIRKVIKEIETIFELRIQGKGVRWISSVSPQVPQRVIGDSKRLVQVISNLLTNAVKFTDSGTIELKVEPVQVREESVTLFFRVSDTGIGIPKDIVPDLFQPFTQADSSYTRKYGGTGLGLSICKGFVEMMHGRIWVEPNEPQGTSFCFTVTMALDRKEPSIPIEQQKEKEIQSADDTLLKLSSYTDKRILVVEDDPVSRKYLRSIIRSLQIPCDEVEDGQKAVELYRKKGYDLVFMDCQMPIMDGYEATRTLRLMQPKDRKLTIYALTAHAMVGDREKCIAAGMDGYIPKPADGQTIIEAIHAAFSSESI